MSLPPIPDTDRPATREHLVGDLRAMILPHLGPYSEEQIAKRIGLSLKDTRKALIFHEIVPLVAHQQMGRRRYSETQVSRLERLLEGCTAREMERQARAEAEAKRGRAYA